MSIYKNIYIYTVCVYIIFILRSSLWQCHDGLPKWSNMLEATGGQWHNSQHRFQTGQSNGQTKEDISEIWKSGKWNPVSSFIQSVLLGGVSLKKTLDWPHLFSWEFDVDVFLQYPNPHLQPALLAGVNTDTHHDGGEVHIPALELWPHRRILIQLLQPTWRLRKRKVT